MADHQIERRTVTAGFELRSVEMRSGGEVRVVAGHGAVFNSLSAPLGGFVERVDPKAFTRTLGAADVRALVNHDPNLILARSSAGTLRLGVDDIGLAYEFDIPDTSYGRDLAVSMERGDITQSSFGFRMISDEWGQADDGTPLRTLTDVSLVDVSPVTYPAYGDADSGLRSALSHLAEVRSISVDEAVAITLSGQLTSLVDGTSVRAKYSADQLREMLAKGQAMRNPSGDPSYPIGDAEDLGNAIHAVGRGGASADAIRKYIMGRAKDLGKTSMIPDTWQADGSLGGTRTEPRAAMPTGMESCPQCDGTGYVPMPTRSIEIAEHRLALMRRRHRIAPLR